MYMRMRKWDVCVISNPVCVIHGHQKCVPQDIFFLVIKNKLVIQQSAMTIPPVNTTNAVGI